MNNTGDTLNLVTYVPLDSVLLEAAALDSVRNRVAADTFPSGQLRSVLTAHHGQWYYVHPGASYDMLDCQPELYQLLAQARHNPATGGTSYRLWPHDIRVLGRIKMGGPYGVSHGPPFSRLTLVQGSANQELTEQEQLIQAFRQEQVRQANPHTSSYRYQLIVEPGLTVKK